MSKGYLTRISIIRLGCLLLMCILFFLISCSEENFNYYIDSKQGDDSNPGNSPNSSWKSLDRINETCFNAGDSILFKCGGIWTGMLYPKGSGKDGNPIVIDKYGHGNMPILCGQGQVENTVYLLNQEYWEINNLVVC